MANIGATTAFYKVETSLSRANNEVSKSMERLATGKQNANAGDRSSYVAMSDTFRLDYVGTKAGIKSASVAMGYLETGMRVIDRASGLLSRLQELAVLGGNNTNTNADNEAINLEAEAIADEFNRLMTTSTYKGKDVFVTNAGNQEVALGGRGQEMTFGIGDIDYNTALYSSSNRSIDGGPNDGVEFNLKTLPSDAVTAKSYGYRVSNNTSDAADSSNLVLTADKKYVIREVGDTDDVSQTDGTDDVSSVALRNRVLEGDVTLTNAAGTAVTSDLTEGLVVNVTNAATITKSGSTGPITEGVSWTLTNSGALGGSVSAKTYSGLTATSTTSTSGTGATFDISVNASGQVTNVVMTDAGDDYAVNDTLTFAKANLGTTTSDLILTLTAVTATSVHFAEVNEGENAFQSGETYVIQTLGTSDGDTTDSTDDAAFIKAAFTDVDGNALSGTLTIGQKIKFAAVDQVITGVGTVKQGHLDGANALIQGMTFTRSTDSLTADIESIQALLNKARVQAGSQYAALESAVDYTTDLTAQYELGFNMVNDVNFSAETAHLAKNQILQQAATAMLAQANSGQQGLLQLIQG
jgi:flagellin